MDRDEKDLGMAKGYIIGMITVDDLEGYKPYMAQTSALVEEYGGRYLARGGDMAVVEGALDHDRFVIIEFDDRETVERFYNDPRYQETRKIRQAHASGTILQVTGYEPA
jgi:uncharacterized protein (DUF1330 family)